MYGRYFTSTGSLNKVAGMKFELRESFRGANAFYRGENKAAKNPAMQAGLFCVDWLRRS